MWGLPPEAWAMEPGVGAGGAVAAGPAAAARPKAAAVGPGAGAAVAAGAAAAAGPQRRREVPGPQQGPALQLRLGFGPGPVPGAEAAVAAEVYDLAFFEQYMPFTANYQQHSAALKWFRQEMENGANTDNPQVKSFSNTEVDPVARINHPLAWTTLSTRRSCTVGGGSRWWRS